MTTPYPTTHVDARADSPRATRTDFHITISDPVVEHIPDEDWRPDPSCGYTDEQMHAFHMGEWGCIGIRVSAEICCWQNGIGTLHQIHSAGLWGVDSPSPDDYTRDVAEEQARELLPLLERLAPEDFDPEAWVKLARDADPVSR